MGFKCGICGLPNVGKSTLFNALTKSASAQAANYPFCTIEPNSGEVAAPDSRLERIAEIAESKEVIPAKISFVDIAGLVEGASKGEGLGNRFLAHIRETDAIIHVLRCFEDDDVSHVEAVVDPIRDAETVESELMLADLESMERRIDSTRKRASGKDPEALSILPAMESAFSALSEGRPVREILAGASKEEKAKLKSLQLLTSKPILYVCNVGEDEAATGNEHSRRVEAMASERGVEAVTISARIEEEIAQMPQEEQGEFLALQGLSESGLDRLIAAGYRLLDLITFFTAGPKEARAWTVRRGSTAPQAAGVIHTDFERGFIRAQTISCEDYLRLGGEAGAREAGKMRDEGKEYVVQDGDVMLFKFNV